MKTQDLNLKDIDQIITLLSAGKIGIMPTDTIYGILGSALNPKTVEEIYQLRKRAKDKPMIILIASIDDLHYFNIVLTDQQRNFLQKNWPNPLSVVLPCNEKKFKYLHRGKNSLAFRIPKKEMLLKILKKVGPLVAPSANYESELPSETIADAKHYFGKQADFYIDEGEIKSKCSTIVKLDEDGKPIILRSGIFQL